MYEKAADYGCVYRQKEPYEVLFTRWISFEEILRLKQTEEMVEVYYNSGQFARTVEEAEKYFSSPFAFYDSLEPSVTGWVSGDFPHQSPQV